MAQCWQQSVHIPTAECWTKWHAARLTCEFAQENTMSQRNEAYASILRVKKNYNRFTRPCAFTPRQVWPIQPHPGSKQTANRVIQCTCVGSDMF
jgi:hypothetical protein